MSTIAMPPPDAAVVARRLEITAALVEICGGKAVIASEDGRRTFETDGLSAYRQMPLAVVLPGSTAEVSRVLRYCSQNGIKVVPRGAGTSLAGGALPTADCVVVGVSRLASVIDIDVPNRAATVGAGITNLGISGAADALGLFYAPDPSSQLACTIAGNIAMNSGGAHCLKYGVTTNNLLGITLVLMDGEILTIGGKYLDSVGYDVLGLVTGSEGQFGIVTEATVRLIAKPEGARPMLVGFPSSEAAGRAVSAIIAAGIIPVAIEFMDREAIVICEAFSKAGYPQDAAALLIIEVEGSAEEIDEALTRISTVIGPVSADQRADQRERGRERGDLEGPQVGVRRHGPGRRLPVHGRHHSARQAAGDPRRHRRHLRQVRAAGRQHIPRRRRQHASAHPLRCQRCPVRLKRSRRAAPKSSPIASPSAVA